MTTDIVRARHFAARSFRPHDWRVSVLDQGRWDHHPDVVDYLAATPEEQKEMDTWPRAK